MLEQSEKSNYLAALSLGVIGLLIILIFVSIRSQADTAGGTATTNIDNVSPVVDSIETPTYAGTAVGTLFTPPASPDDIATNARTTATVTYNISDANLCGDVAVRGSWVAAIHHTDVADTACDVRGEATGNTEKCFVATAAGASITDDGADTGIQCSQSCASDDLTATITCTVPVYNYSLPGVWSADLYLTDEGALTGSRTGGSDFTVKSVSSISLQNGDLNFGAMALGATSTADSVTSYVRNSGNQALAIAAYGDASTFSCTQKANAATFPIANLTFSTSSGVSYGSKAGIMDTESVSVSSLAAQTEVSEIRDGTEYSTVYWGLQIPSSGVGGTCSTTITVSGT